MKTIILLMITITLSSCGRGKILDQCPPTNGDIWLSFSVLDKSTKEDLLDPKSDNPKAIDFAKVQTYFLGKNGFVKNDENDDVSLEQKENNNLHNNKFYIVFRSHNSSLQKKKEAKRYKGLLCLNGVRRILIQSRQKRGL